MRSGTDIKAVSRFPKNLIFIVFKTCSPQIALKNNFILSQNGKQSKPRDTFDNDLAKSLDLSKNHETQISVVKQNHDFLKKVKFFM